MKICFKLILCLILINLVFVPGFNVSAVKMDEYHNTFNNYMEFALDEYFSTDEEHEYIVDLLTAYSNENGFIDLKSEHDKDFSADYVLAYCTNGVVSDSVESIVLGDYYLIEGIIGIPYKYSYHILTPKDNKVYTLEEAFNAEIKGIDKLFSENINAFKNHSSFTGLVGDINFDNSLNIKDVTELQKILAELMEPKLENELGIVTISDFNRDGKRNIRDATAIQKYLVGLEY